MTEPRDIHRPRKHMVYFTDAEWAWLREEAHRRQVTISSLVRAAVAWSAQDNQIEHAGLVAQLMEDQSDPDMIDFTEEG